MWEEIPWIIKTVSADKLEEANDLAANGWQPFAVDGGVIYFKRVGTTSERYKVPECCASCKQFTRTGTPKEDKPAPGYCALLKCSTNEFHYCPKYESK